MTSRAQLDRMLAILAFAQSDREVTVADLAKTFEVEEHEILKDLKRMFMCGLPGGYPGDLIEIDIEGVHQDGVIRLSNAEYLNRPLQLTVDEALSLQVALSLLKEVAVGHEAQVVDQVITKISELTQTAQIGIETVAGDEKIRAKLVEAIDGGKRIQLVYDSLTQTTKPTIDPLEIQLNVGNWYLQAWSVERNDWRSFRLDRIIDVIDIHQKVQPHAMPSQLFSFEDGLGEVVLKFDSQASWVVDYYLCDQIKRFDDASVQARFVVGRYSWLACLLLRLAQHVIKVEPGDVRELAYQQAQNAIALNEQLAALNEE